MKRIISNVAVVDPRRLRMWYHGMVVAFALSFLLAFKWEYELLYGVLSEQRISLQHVFNGHYIL